MLTTCRPSWLALAAGCLLGLSPATASAQVIQGALTTSSKVSKSLRPGSYHNLHNVYLQAGQTYTIDVRSRDFDTYAFLLDSARNVLAENDDRTSSDLNSQIVYNPGSTGWYEVAVSTFQRGATGNYTISVQGSSVASGYTPLRGTPAYSSSTSNYYSPQSGGGQAYTPSGGSYGGLSSFPNLGGGNGMINNNANVAQGSTATQAKAVYNQNGQVIGYNTFNNQGQFVGYRPAGAAMHPQLTTPGYGGGMPHGTVLPHGNGSTHRPH